MDATPLVVGPVQLLWSLGMVAIAIALVSWQRFGIAGSLLIASGRTILQLAVVGYVLAAVFALNHPAAVLVVLVAMTATAAIVARNRISQKVPQLLPWVGGAIFTGAMVTLLYTTTFVVRPQPWFMPQYVIPLGGILLGNSMNAAAIAGDRLVSSLNANQTEIETHLSLGASPQRAIAVYRQEAARAGLIPLINTMTVIGLVTLPGIMTGQMLGGANPLVAAAYQMVIMFMLALANVITTIIVIQGICRQFFNAAEQFQRW
jgi:putative ABC transport system permease protein